VPPVLVFLPNRGFFGASLVVIPALLELRRRFPGAELVGCSTSPAHRCFVDWGLISAFHHYPKPFQRGFVAPVRAALRLRPAAVVNMRPGSEWVQLWSWLVPAPQRWCFDQGFGRWMDRRRIRFDVGRYKAFNYLGLLPGDPGVRDGDLLEGWDQVTPAPAGRRLVLLPSGSHPEKLWPPEHYETVLRWWLSGRGDGATVIAGPSEKAVLAWFAERRLGELPGVRLMVGNPLAEQAAEIRAAAAVVHNDCGPGHLAQLMDRPRVVLFPHWGDPREWFRPGARARCLIPPAGQAIASIAAETVTTALSEIAA
jgi:hypothetical protein